jgi:hypothetical protein
VGVDPLVSEFEQCSDGHFVDFWDAVRVFKRDGVVFVLNEGSEIFERTELLKQIEDGTVDFFLFGALGFFLVLVMLFLIVVISAFVFLHRSI